MKKIFVTVLIIFLAALFVPSFVFAANVEVIGKVIGSNNMPIPQTRIVFQNAQSQSVETTVNFNGAYVISIPAGTYTVTVIPPAQSGIPKLVQTNQKFDTTGMHDITVSSPIQFLPQQKTIELVILAVALILLAGGIGYVLRKKRW